MPKYVMLSTLGPDGAATLVNSPERLRQVNDEVEAMGVKVLEQYALLGPYDFCNIIEAPDGQELPVEFTSEDVRRERKRQGMWWY